ncbi:hypothetical protein PR202_ga07796 [Eleusine coracana subsp. coracana]|uniref:Expansin-like EG45 domain-containing protein n=1 Tax=Eleusine coracana subsp. coracana TaxID=191504 RepID=A0AAV5C0J4_ELECO|nr:hypothetical protein PR202_ga07796 [Eleusine coracana subsp. coracana]
MGATKMPALVAVLFAVLFAHGAHAQPANNSTSELRRQLQGKGGWIAAKATWYGAPTGAGPYDNGGACGYKKTNQYPFMSMTSCGNQPLFKDGDGCGACYQHHTSQPNYLAVLAEYANKDGTVVQKMDLQDKKKNARYWTPMRRSWGASLASRLQTAACRVPPPRIRAPQRVRQRWWPGT